MKTANILNWIVAVAGLWLLLSPFILGYSAMTVAMWNALIVGVVVAALGVGAALYKNVTADRTLDWINAALGLWVIISPFVLGFSAMATLLWNNIIVGVIVLALGVWANFVIGKEVSPQT